MRGIEDSKGTAIAAFCAGSSFSFVSNIGAPKNLPKPPPGQPMLPSTPAGFIIDAVRTGVMFALLQGVFGWIGNQMSGSEVSRAAPFSEDIAYAHTKMMLHSLGLTQFEKNFRKGQLGDATLPLLTDSALSEVKVPPGPRLLILNNVNAYQQHYQACAA